jgi:hypothetical protein
MKNKPLKQTEYSMLIVEDLGTISSKSGRNGRYALFECTECKLPFKARAGGSAIKNQTKCKQCFLVKKRMSTHPLYTIWNGIKQRCYCVSRKDYGKYGGKGVTMQASWIDNPKAFITWCEEQGWKKGLVVDKDIKSREQGFDPPIYSESTLSFILPQENAEEANGKEVLKLSLTGEILETFPSARKAADSVGVNKSTLANCCRGLTMTCKSFRWKYK